MVANEYGVQLQVETSYSLVGCTKLTLRGRSPDGTVKDFAATPPGSGTSFTYTTLSGDFDVAGTGTVMCEAQFGSTMLLRSDDARLLVGVALEKAA